MANLFIYIYIQYISNRIWLLENLIKAPRVILCPDLGQHLNPIPVEQIFCCIVVVVAFISTTEMRTATLRHSF